MRRGPMWKQTTVQHSSASSGCEGGSPFPDASTAPAGNKGLTPSQRLALAFIRGYQILVRPLLTGSCRYLPSCSEYAAEAIVTYGALRGGWLGLRRVLRCHPFGGAGLDPVP
jgi:putative membrane protein insertion efficiency factor